MPLSTKLSSALIAISALGVTLSVGCFGGRDVSGLTEASTSFDLEALRPFLMRVSAHIEGFGPAEIDPLVDEISSMTVDSENAWDFDVVYQGATVPLHIRVFMDDVEAPDVYFFTTPELAAEINRETEAYFRELGI